MAVDYSLYLVTDSTREVLGDKDLALVVEEALEGGVTIVQYRDKVGDTATLVQVAKRLHAITQRYGVPFLINDRVDVALAVGAEGVHLGQDDLDLETARRLLGPEAIIGATCSNVDEAHSAITRGCNYLGVGTMFPTTTKKNSKAIVGTAGTKAILDYVSRLTEGSKQPAAVAIGGINLSNVQRVMFQSQGSLRGLDGIAVVSAIIAAESPKYAATELRRLVNSPSPFGIHKTDTKCVRTAQELLLRVPSVIRQLRKSAPVCHNMTNLVVQNFAANVALAIERGASPIMANDGGEAEDLAKLEGALVINMGSATPDGIVNCERAIQAYNSTGVPVLLDPVGAGATQLRREAVSSLMKGGYFDVIKGNESEIATVLGSIDVQQRGVDSGRSKTTVADKTYLVKTLATQERNVVVMTGAVDCLSDGDRTYLVRNGHALLSQVTGTGCTLGTTIAACMAVEKDDKLLASLAGLLLFEIAAEQAASRAEVNGPGTFVPAFIDSLSHLAHQAEVDQIAWVHAAKVEEVHF